MIQREKSKKSALPKDWREGQRMRACSKASRLGHPPGSDGSLPPLVGDTKYVDFLYEKEDGIEHILLVAKELRLITVSRTTLSQRAP